MGWMKYGCGLCQKNKTQQEMESIHCSTRVIYNFHSTNTVTTWKDQHNGIRPCKLLIVWCSPIHTSWEPAPFLDALRDSWQQEVPPFAWVPMTLCDQTAPPFQTWSLLPARDRRARTFLLPRKTRTLETWFKRPEIHFPIVFPHSPKSLPLWSRIPFVHNSLTRPPPSPPPSLRSWKGTLS